LCNEFNELNERPRRMSLVVTSPWSGVANERALLELSAWFDASIVPRANRSIVQLCLEEEVDAVVVADSPPKLYHRLNPTKPLFFHPGMAMQRVLRLRRGERDRLLDVAGVTAGDTVVDATLGAGADALVLAEGVGPDGRVVACESSLPVARLFTYAIQTRYYQPPWLAALLGRIEVQEQEHLTFLRHMDDKSVHVVYFDAMFEQPLSEDANVESLRPFADFSPLSAEAVEEAKRVARRSVVAKGILTSAAFTRHGFQPDKPKSRFAYGAIRLQPSS